MYDLIIKGLQARDLNDSFIKRYMSFNKDMLLLLINAILAHILMGAIYESAELSDKVRRLIPILGVGFGDGCILNTFGYEEDTDLERFVESILFNSDSGGPVTIDSE